MGKGINQLCTIVRKVQVKLVETLELERPSSIVAMVWILEEKLLLGHHTCAYPSVMFLLIFTHL